MLKQLGVRKGDISSAHKYAREIDDHLSATAPSATGAVTSQYVNSQMVVSHNTVKNKSRRRRAGQVSIDLTQESAYSSGKNGDGMPRNTSRSLLTLKNAVQVQAPLKSVRGAKEPRQLSLAELREPTNVEIGVISERHTKDSESWGATGGRAGEEDADYAAHRQQARSDLHKVAAVAAKKRRTGGARNVNVGRQ